MSKSNEKIEIAVITSPHGLKGQVKLAVFLQNPSEITSYSPLCFEDGSAAEIKIVGSHKEKLICEISGCTTRENAEKLAKQKIYIEKSQLPAADEGEFYYSDLVGLTVIKGKKEIGEVIGVHNFGAGDIIEIKFNNGTGEMFMFTQEFFGKISDKKIEFKGA